MLSRISINTSFQILARGFEFISGLLVNAWLARQWGSLAFGQIGFFSGLAGTCSFLFDFGLGSLLVRSIARDRPRARQLLLQALVAMLPLALLGTTAILGFGIWIAGPSSAPILALTSLQMFLAGISLLIQAAFYAFERMEFESFSVFFERASWLGAGLWLAIHPPSLIALYSWLCICKGLNILIGGFLLVRHILPGTGPVFLRPSESLALLRQAFPFGLNVIFSTLYVSIDILLLSRWVGDAEAGLYRAACMLIVPVTMIAIALNNALFPKMSAKPEAVFEYSKASARIAAAAAMPICLFTAFFAPSIIQLVYGAAYAPAARLLQLLSLVIPLRFINHSFSTVLTACDKQNQRTACAGIAAAFNIASNALIIGRWHSVGACLTTLATDLLRTVILLILLRQHSGKSPLEFPPAFQSLALSALILTPLAYSGVPPFAAGLLLLLLYPALLLKIRVLSPSELKLLWRTT